MSINVKISDTAIAVASLRALSNYEQDEQFRCNDHFAEDFLPDEKKIPLRNAGVRETIKKAIPKGMYEYVISRTKYFDKVFLDAVRQGIGQIVFLGAGFDSRPYRFNALLDNTKIFEVDTEATQTYKRTVLLKMIDTLKNITYVSHNFEDDQLFLKLKKNGYDPSEKALFVWEGVTFYLTHEAVIRMLDGIRNNSADGSLLCFDFQTINCVDDLIKTGLEKESIKFGIGEGKISQFVASNQFKIREHLNSEAIEQRFMKKDTGVVVGNIAPIMNFILLEHR